ncbi:MAG: tetratricopeptide repeat protein [Gammaproteobacteria bacterium]|nr:tetratricopeptide repeat protein [Gammaproteobacteria bacterium]CAJ2376731.1 MAG: putative membrane protein [Arenicellales bacterium IbO2]MDA7961107.1 tetratricopeptide repeat protein [Gammaproteobacteria bacterium]MDA7967420.1 tetratricopeptide repeat protein [Gammaproteobacteria bacterium]MDA7969492.1 tetratricopeptide repeat protein [Gammaproteobacteria bacterium]
MADEELRHPDDPELARARAWWNDYGRAIVGGVAVALVAVTGYNYWQNHQQTRAVEASGLYEQLRAEIGAAEEASDEAEGGESADDDDATSEDTAESEAAIASLADRLMRDYASTPYAIHAAFALAKFAVESGDDARATAALQWALDNGNDDILRHVARLRLAALLLAGGRADEAADLLQAAELPAFAERYHELRGDAAFQRGDRASARAHWQSGLDAMPRGDASRALLQLKLNNLTVGGG